MTLFVVYFSGCGDSDNNGNNTSSSSISSIDSSTNSSEMSSATSSSDQNSSISSSQSSSTGNSSSVDNTGNALNSLGYYGEGVYLGSEPILGKWEMGIKDGGSPSGYFNFYYDGTGLLDSTNLSGYGYTYGINQNGTVFFIHPDGSYQDGEPNVGTYECLRFEDKCCYLNTDTNLTLCKVAEENASN